MGEVGVSQRVTGLVEHLIVLQEHSLQVRLQGREIIRLERRQEPIGPVVSPLICHW
jgi:hypothetical protein